MTLCFNAWALLPRPPLSRGGRHGAVVVELSTKPRPAEGLTSRPKKKAGVLSACVAPRAPKGSVAS